MEVGQAEGILKMCVETYSLPRAGPNSVSGLWAKGRENWGGTEHTMTVSLTSHLEMSDPGQFSPSTAEECVVYRRKPLKRQEKVIKTVRMAKGL